MKFVEKPDSIEEPEAYEIFSLYSHFINFVIFRFLNDILNIFVYYHSMPSDNLVFISIIVVQVVYIKFNVHVHCLPYCPFSFLEIYKMLIFIGKWPKTYFIVNSKLSGNVTSTFRSFH